MIEWSEFWSSLAAGMVSAVSVISAACLLGVKGVDSEAAPSFKSPLLFFLFIILDSVNPEAGNQNKNSLSHLVLWLQETDRKLNPLDHLPHSEGNTMQILLPTSMCKVYS